jgi:hypothetical protein
MANTKIKIKQSAVTGNTPSASQLDQGELALNTADQKLFSKDSTGAIFEIGAATANAIMNNDWYMDGGSSSINSSNGGAADIVFDTQQNTDCGLSI